MFVGCALICILIRICFIVIHVPVLTSANIFDKPFEDELDSYVRKTLNCRHVPGMTLSVVNDTETWTRGYGLADIDSQRKVDNTTLFNIGSISKSFTMILLGVLLTEKNMTWRSKVADILGPDYEFVDEYRTREMMLRDLLSHRTGLARLDIGLFAGIPEDVTRDQLCRKMKYLPERLPFRDYFIYNNYMYMMLGHIAEKLGGDTWENLMTSKVLRPIGMTSTKILKSPADVLKENVARPYIYKDEKFANSTLELYDLHPVEPAGAILSNAEDMAKYIRFNLKYGVLDNGKTLVDLKLITEAFKTTTPTIDASFDLTHFYTKPEFPVSETAIGYGYAWFTSTYNGYLRYWHSGGLFSYISLLWLYPEKQIGIFGSVNGPALPTLPSVALQSVFYSISDKLFGEDPWINENTTCEYPDLWRNKSTNSTPPEPTGDITFPQEYVGRYGSKFLPDITVSEVQGNNTVLEFQMNKVGGVLHSTEDIDRFLMEITYPWEIMVTLISNNMTTKLNTTFSRSKGKVTGLEVDDEVKVRFDKGVSILDKDVSGAIMMDATLLLCLVELIVLFLVIR